MDDDSALRLADGGLRDSGGPSDASIDAGAKDGGPGRDASVDGGPDAGDAAPVYPAAHTPLPQVRNPVPGPIMGSPKFVTIVNQADPLKSSIEDVMSRVGASSYWKIIGADYHVGPATALAPNEDTAAAPTTIDDSAI